MVCSESALMRTYKNRLPMPACAQVWHYTSLEAVVAMLHDRRIRLTRVDTFPDELEGSLTYMHIEDRSVILSSNDSMMACMANQYADMDVPHPRYRDHWKEAEERTRVARRSAHAICWVNGDEHACMWRLYCTKDGPQGRGLALLATLGKLEVSVAHLGLHVGPVRYLSYDEGDAFDDALDLFFHKRMVFQNEHE